MRDDILREFALGQPLRQKQIDGLVGQGIPPLWLARTFSGVYAFLQYDRVVMLGDRFEFARNLPDGDGVGAFTLLLFDADGDPADIMAWRPPEFALWLGGVSCLGEEQVLGPRLADPLPLRTSVIDWLRARREGIMILDHAQAAHLLRNETLGVLTPAHENDLRAKLTLPGRRSSSSVKRSARLERQLHFRRGRCAIRIFV